MRKDAKDVIMNINNARYLELMEAEIQLKVLRATVTPLREAAEHFIDKVDSGKARSVESYKQFKDALIALDAAPATGEEAAPTGYIDVVFDGPPAHKSGRFIEVEDAFGQGVDFGEWVQRNDEYWVLRIPLVNAPMGNIPAPPPPVPVGIDPAALAKVRDEYAKIRGQGMFVNIENVVTDLTALIANAGEQGPVKCHRCHRLVTSHSPICWPCQQLIAAKFDQGPMVQVAVVDEALQSRCDECNNWQHGKCIIAGCRDNEVVKDALAPHRAAPAADKPAATEPDSDRVMAQKRISERLAATRRKRDAQIELEIGADASEPVRIPTTEERAAWWLGTLRPILSPGQEAASLAAAITGCYNTEVTAWLDAQADGKERG